MSGIQNIPKNEINIRQNTIFLVFLILRFFFCRFWFCRFLGFSGCFVDVFGDFRDFDIFFGFWFF